MGPTWAPLLASGGPSLYSHPPLIYSQTYSLQKLYPPFELNLIVTHGYKIFKLLRLLNQESK